MASFQYDATNNVYWGVANSIPTAQLGVFLQKAFKFDANGATLFSFDIHGTIPVADRFNPLNWADVRATTISLIPNNTEIYIYIIWGLF